MADIVPNIALGRVNELVRRVVNNDPANSAIIVTLLQAAGTDAALKDFDDLAAILADASNTEADFTNFARKTLTEADVSLPTVDDGADTQSSDLPDQTFVAAGGAANNTLVKLIVALDLDTTSGTDADIIPLSIQDFTATTDGNDLTATINNFFIAS